MGALDIYNADRPGLETRSSSAIFVAVCALPMLTTLLFGGVDTITLGIISVVVSLTFLLWVIDALRTGEFRFSVNILQLPIAALILLALFQLLPIGDHGIAQNVLGVPPSRSLTMDPFATQLFIVRFAGYLIFFAVALAYIDTVARVKKLTVAIICFGSILAFFGILQRLADPETIYGLRNMSQAIAFGPFVNQHHFAAFMELTSGLVFGLLLGSGSTRDKKMFLLIAAILMSVALFFTGSRGGVISFAGVVAFAVAATYFFRKTSGKESFVANERSRSQRFALLAGAAAFSLLIIGMVFYLGGGDSLLRGFGFQEQYVDVSSGRIHYWSTSLKIIQAHPFIGAGLDAFAAAYTQFDTNSGLYRVEQAHNDYLQMLTDGGIVGFLCVAAFLFFLFRNGIRTIVGASDELNRSIAIGALAGCFGIAIHSFFDFPLRTPSNALFLFLFAVLATNGTLTKSKRAD